MAGNYLTLHTNDRVVVTTSRGNQEKWFDAEKNLWYKVDDGCFEALAEAVSSEVLRNFTNAVQLPGISVIVPVFFQPMTFLFCISAEQFRVCGCKRSDGDFFTVKRKFYPVIFLDSHRTKPHCREIDRILFCILSCCSPGFSSHNFHAATIHALHLPLQKEHHIGRQQSMILFCQQNSKNLCNTKSPTLNTASESDYLWSEQKSIC